MELGPKQVVPADGCGYWPAIVRGRKDIGSIRAHHMIGVNEVGVSTIIEVLENGVMELGKFKFIPAHMGYFERGI